MNRDSSTPPPPLPELPGSLHSPTNSSLSPSSPFMGRRGRGQVFVSEAKPSLKIPGEGEEGTKLVSEKNVLPIYDVTPFTMLDFPECTACVIWFSGCNMRCPYCHNPAIVKSKGRQNSESVLGFLEKRKGLLDGVVLSGGEATLYPDLSNFVQYIRKMGFAIKLDTNGTRPDVIRDFLEKDLLDYIALDYKAPPEKFKAVTGSRKFEAFEKTLDFLCGQKNVPFEVRTTVHTALMDEADIAAIMADLEARAYKGPYYVQNFRAGKGRSTLGCLPEQPYVLDISKISETAAFPVSFRNFS